MIYYRSTKASGLKKKFEAVIKKRLKMEEIKSLYSNLPEPYQKYVVSMLRALERAAVEHAEEKANEKKAPAIPTSANPQK